MTNAFRQVGVQALAVREKQAEARTSNACVPSPPSVCYELTKDDVLMAWVRYEEG